MANHIGCSGWSYAHWAARFYKGVPQKGWLEFYTKHFDTVELNMSFYRWPSKTMIENWLSRTPKNFLFTVKANREITHYMKFNNTQEIVTKFYKLLDNFEEKLGCILWQLPPSFKFDEQKLKDVTSQLDKNYRNVVEFRHKSWWNESTYEQLKKHDIILCTVGAPKIPMEFIKTADDVYVRMHGSEWYKNLYSKEELEECAKQIKKLKPKNTWGYFDNDENAYAVQNALELKEILG